MSLPTYYIILTALGQPYGRWHYMAPTKRTRPKLYSREYDALNALSLIKNHHKNDKPEIHEVHLVIGKKVEDETSSS